MLGVNKVKLENNKNKEEIKRLENLPSNPEKMQKLEADIEQIKNMLLKFQKAACVMNEDNTLNINNSEESTNDVEEESTNEPEEESILKRSLKKKEEEEEEEEEEKTQEEKNNAVIEKELNEFINSNDLNTEAQNQAKAQAGGHKKSLKKLRLNNSNKKVC